MEKSTGMHPVLFYSSFFRLNVIRMYNKIPETAKNKYTRQNGPLSQVADAKPSQLFNTVTRNSAMLRKNTPMPKKRKILRTASIFSPLLLTLTPPIPEISWFEQKKRTAS